MPRIESNRSRRIDAEPRRGKRTISKRLIRARKQSLHATLAKYGGGR